MEEKYGHYNDDTEKKNRLGMNVVFGMIMIAIYLGMAYLLLFTSLFSNFIRYSTLYYGRCICRIWSIQRI